MRIKPSEGVTGASMGSVRPPMVVQLTQGAPEELHATSVALSNTVRGLANALTQGLPAALALRVYEILTAEDRMMLAWATEFASAQGIELGEVRKLVHDLFAYRMEELALGELEPAPNEVAAPAGAAARKQGALLAIPAFAPRDESLARTILSSLALRDTLVDRAFVHAVLDPDRGVAHAVDFEFLRRVVVALSPAHSDALLDTSLPFGRRDARAVLALAVAQLELTATDLADALPAAVERGEQLLRVRLPRAALAPVQAAELHRSWRVLARSAIAELTRSDRAVLRLLYVAAQARGTDLKAVDQVARALIALRTAERTEVEEGRGARERNEMASAAPSAPRETNAIARPSQPVRSAPRAENPDDAVHDQHVRQPRGEPVVHEPESGVRDHARAAARRGPSDETVESKSAIGIPRDARELERTPTGGAPENGRATATQRDARELARGRSEAALSEPGSTPAPVPAVVRSYGSATQIAARASGTYRSLAGPGEAWFSGLPNAGERPPHEVTTGLASQRPASAAGAPALPGASARPLDLAQALGASALAGQILAQSRVRRTRPRARKRAGVSAIEGLREAAYESEADAASPDGSPRRRHMRWQLLLQRRKQMRPRVR